MSFWADMATMARKRAVAVPVALATVLAGALGFLLTPTHYQVSELLVLTTPAAGGTLSQDPQRPTGLTNPMLNFGDGLKIASGILIQTVNTKQAQEQLAGTDGRTTMTVDDGRSNPSLLDSNGPFVFIAVDSTDSATATSVAAKITARLQQELLDRQRALKAPASTYITLVPVVAAGDPDATVVPKVRIGAVAAIVTLAVGMLGAWVLGRRRNRRVGAPQGPPSGPTPDDRAGREADPDTDGAGAGQHDPPRAHAVRSARIVDHPAGDSDGDRGGSDAGGDGYLDDRLTAGPGPQLSGALDGERGDRPTELADRAEPADGQDGQDGQPEPELADRAEPPDGQDGQDGQPEPELADRAEPADRQHRQPEGERREQPEAQRREQPEAQRREQPNQQPQAQHAALADAGGSRASTGLLTLVRRWTRR